MGSVIFGAKEVGVETANVAFLSETQYMKDFLNSIDVDGFVRHRRFLMNMPG